MHRPAGLAVALVALLAGCVEPPSAEELPGLVAPHPRTLFFTELMTLGTDAPADETGIPLAPFFQAWQAGADYPTWAADPPEGDFFATSIEVRLHVRATGPVLQSGRFPDIMVYAGSGDAWMGYGGTHELTALRPGDSARLDIEVELPDGGLWLSPEAALGLKVVPVMLQQEQANLEVVVGGERGSRVVVETGRVDVARASAERGVADGEARGTIYAGAAAAGGTEVALPMRSGPTYVLVWMNTTRGEAGVPDLDLALMDPSGRLVASAGTPTPWEALRVAGPNLREAGDHKIVVTAAANADARFRVEWIVGYP